MGKLDFDYKKIDDAISEAIDKYRHDVFEEIFKEIDLYIGYDGEVIITLPNKDEQKRYNLADMIRNDLDQMDGDILQELKTTLEKCLQIVNAEIPKWHKHV